MASRKTLELFYDVLSPYSWIGFEVLLRYRPVWKINLELQPFFLAAIMKESGNSPPGMVLAKQTYMRKDIARLVDFYNLEQIVFPSDPVNVFMVKGSLPTMRLLTAAKVFHGDKLGEMTREFCRRVNQTDEDIASPESLLEVCQKVGLNADDSHKLLEQSRSNDIKTKLMETTQRALDHGAFGSPTILVDDAEGQKQMFFGSDRFHLIAQLLGVQWPGPLNSGEQSKL